MQSLKIAKWGNSLAVRLPAQLVAQLKVVEGERLKVRAVPEGELDVARDSDREAALARIAARRWKVPEAFKFDREEANER